jgi:integrase/recombinase XerD
MTVARVLSKDEIDKLFNEGFQLDRDRALFGMCLYTACKINEACMMHTVDAFQGNKVRSHLLIPKIDPDGKRVSRNVPTHPQLEEWLRGYRPFVGDHPYLFPGRHGRGYINPRSAAAILKQACDHLGLDGISTHSFRKTTLVKLCKDGLDIPSLLSISGLDSVAALQKYLNLGDTNLSEAITSLNF